MNGDLLAEAGAHGCVLSLSGDAITLSAEAPPPPDLLARLRAAKPELLALLRGEACRHCGEPVSWSRPGAVAFADGTGAHLACYEQAGAAS